MSTARESVSVSTSSSSAPFYSATPFSPDSTSSNASPLLLNAVDLAAAYDTINILHNWTSRVDRASSGEGIPRNTEIRQQLSALKQEIAQLQLDTGRVDPTQPDTDSIERGTDTRTSIPPDDNYSSEANLAYRFSRLQIPSFTLNGPRLQVSFSSSNLLGKGGLAKAYKGTLYLKAHADDDPGSGEENPGDSPHPLVGIPIAFKKWRLREPIEDDEFDDEPLEFQQQQSTSLLRDIRREAKSMWRVQGHPGCVHLYGVCASPVALVMEFCNHGSLYAQLYGTDNPNVKRTHLTLIQKLIGVDQMMRALAHLHAREVFHLDLKSHNILVHSPVLPLIAFKLSDLGSASLRTTETLFRTKGRLPAITQRWEPPEMQTILNENLFTVASSRLAAMDVYSLGCVLGELFTGLLPYATYRDGWPLQKAKEKRTPPYTAEQFSSLPPMIYHLVSACLSGAHHRPPLDVILCFFWSIVVDECLGIITTEQALKQWRDLLNEQANLTAMTQDQARIQGIIDRLSVGHLTVPQLSEILMSLCSDRLPVVGWTLDQKQFVGQYLLNVSSTLLGDERVEPYAGILLSQMAAVRDPSCAQISCRVVLHRLVQLHQRHRSEEVNQHVCAALTTILSSDDTLDDEELRMASRLILSILRSPSLSSDLQEKCIALCASLVSQYNAASYELVQGGAVPILSSVLMNHYRDLKTCVNVCDLLVAMISDAYSVMPEDQLNDVLNTAVSGLSGLNLLMSRQRSKLKQLKDAIERIINI